MSGEQMAVDAQSGDVLKSWAASCTRGGRPALRDALAFGSDVGTLLHALKRVMISNMNWKELRDSGIGPRVVILRGHPNSSVSRIAAFMVDAWKRARADKSTVAPVDTRMRARDMLERALQLEPDPPLDSGVEFCWDPTTAAREIECKLTEMHGTTGTAYRAHVRQICLNFVNVDSTLRRDLLVCESSPARVCEMLSWAMAPTWRRKQILQAELTALAKAEETKMFDYSGDGMFPCRNRQCRSARTLVTQLQTRSGDEGMTVFVTCIDCKRRYKL
jgi:hypothetical protein